MTLLNRNYGILNKNYTMANQSQLYQTIMVHVSV